MKMFWASILSITSTLAVTLLVAASGLTASAIVWLTRRQRSAESVVWAVTLVVAVAGGLLIGAVAAWPGSRTGTNEAARVGSGAYGGVIHSRVQHAPPPGPDGEVRARGVRKDSGSDSQDAPSHREAVDSAGVTTDAGSGGTSGGVAGGEPPGPPAGAGPPH